MIPRGQDRPPFCRQSKIQKLKARLAPEFLDTRSPECGGTEKTREPSVGINLVLLSVDDRFRRFSTVRPERMPESYLEVFVTHDDDILIASQAKSFSFPLKSTVAVQVTK